MRILKHQADRVIRINISLPPALLKRAKRLIVPMMYSDFSGLIAGLLRREIEQQEQQEKQRKPTARLDRSH